MGNSGIELGGLGKRGRGDAGRRSRAEVAGALRPFGRFMIAILEAITARGAARSSETTIMIVPPALERRHRVVASRQA